MFCASMSFIHVLSCGVFVGGSCPLLNTSHERPTTLYIYVYVYVYGPYKYLPLHNIDLEVFRSSG